MIESGDVEAALDEEGRKASERWSDDARPWLEALAEAQRQSRAYDDQARKIEQRYASLQQFSQADDEFQVFWANVEVLRPSVYSRAPQPVVSVRHNRRDPLMRRAAEALERALSTAFDLGRADEVMDAVVDDLVIVGRGVAWLFVDDPRDERGAPGYVGECRLKHVQRDDFAHGPARSWEEVGWVAVRGYATLDEGLLRFGDVFMATQRSEREVGVGVRRRDRTAEVWEIWSREQRRVVWVSPGCDVVLDQRTPWIDVDGFYPCPRPAFATLQRRSLTPVPDYVYIKDQVEEVASLTRRIGALTEALRVRGFYAAGASDIGDAIETALEIDDDRQVLVGVANMHLAASGRGLGDAIVWLPIDQVAAVIRQLIEVRRQVIDDIYQITGLSDIMRGATAASETARAQELKAQYGSIRIRRRQQEVVRFARDLLRLKAEVMAELYEATALRSLAGMDEMPFAEELAATRQELEARALLGDSTAAGTLQHLEQATPFDAVVSLLRNERLRPFVLDVETDSTIEPDEQSEKARRTEFITAVGGFIGQALPMVERVPQSAPFAMEALKFVASGFRAGRSLEGVLDEFAEQMQQVAAQAGQGGREATPEQQRAEAEIALAQQRQQAELAMAQQRLQAELTLDAERMRAEVALRREEAMARLQIDRERSAMRSAMGAQRHEVEVTS